MTRDCSERQAQLAAYIDRALASAERGRLEAHLSECPTCRRELEIQQVARQIVSAHGRATSAVAPPWLRTRLEARLAAEASPTAVPGWRTRFSAFAAAAMVMLAAGAIAVPIVTGRSTVVLAAQLALDHLKCFTIDGDDQAETVTVPAAETELSSEYGWSLRVPSTAGADDARLVAVRRCLYGDGRAAHLLYRQGHERVSLFILPGVERPSRALTVLGQDEVVWSAGGRTYVLVAAEGRRDQLLQMASNLRNEAQ